MRGLQPECGGRFADREYDFLSGNPVSIPSALLARWAHLKMPSIRAGKFGTLVGCFRQPDRDVRKWHGEKAGIVVGVLNLYRLGYPLFSRQGAISTNVSER